ncbi:type IV secretory system conjugative DNA transfer family protein [Blastococcus saxobsidens]|uniref:TraM-binding TraD/TraG-like protein n=1 Tax=Blastococcus saxobsidens TaxID=138336 RepID=A0A4Q7YAI4_9ACTN|nr:TraM recognition domain-containing protein [Blastococcus saxobsidens]RZU33413.1 TraM-binding TraD/TraG-like protein [Blastococcus saxobsidens]
MTTLQVDQLNGIDWLDQHPDPWLGLLDRYLAGPWAQKRLWLGVRHDVAGNVEPVFSEPERNVLWLGAPKVNKTHGGLAPQAIAWNGPAVIMSVKPDLAYATALHRARYGGTIWHLDPTGGKLIPGAVEGRWSPIEMADSWGGAQRVAAGLAGAGTRDTQSGNNAKFWESLAGAYMAVPLLAAKLAGKDMRFVLSVINGVESAIDELEQILGDTDTDDARAALEKWTSLSAMTGAIKDSIVVTSSQALNIYDRGETLERSLEPNIDPYDFVSGGRNEVNFCATERDGEVGLANMGVTRPSGVPVTGQYPTLYITASTGDAEDAQAIMRTIIRQFWDACRRLHEEDVEAGVRDRRPLLLICDELTNLAPDPAYPSIVSQCVDQGMVIASGIQDLGQVESRFGRDGETFLTLHNEVLIFPGIKNEKTLSTISNILGKRWVKFETQTQSGGADPAKTGWSISESWHETPHVPIDQVRDGLPSAPGAVLRLPPTGFEYIYPSPVYRSKPWPRMVVTTLEWFLRRSAHDTGPAFLLPVPELDRKDSAGNYLLAITQRDGDELLDRYIAAANAFTKIAGAAYDQGESPEDRWFPDEEQEPDDPDQDGGASEGPAGDGGASTDSRPGDDPIEPEEPQP